MQQKIIKLIYCAGGNKRFSDIAIENGFLFGSQLPACVYHYPYFADQDWKKPQKEKYISLIKKHLPKMATVIDIESDETRTEAIEWGNRISRYVDKIIIIPKIECDIPRYINGKEVVVGYSVPTKYGGTDLPISMFKGRKIHLLGGSPHRQMDIFLENRNDIYSADGNYHQKMAIEHNKVWVAKEKTKRKNSARGTFVKLSDYLGEKCEKDCPYVAFELSCKNIMAEWINLFDKGE